MATVITDECINCGACEPECPNTAIYQGGAEWELEGQRHPPISTATFYIVPEKCTECVGFYDHEACAAVCPVDCCIPDPARPESEEVLILRARKLHPDAEFPAEIPSRFRKAGAVPAAAPAASASAPAPVSTAAPAPAVVPAPPPKTAPVVVAAGPQTATRVEKATSPPQKAVSPAVAKTFAGELDEDFDALVHEARRRRETGGDFLSRLLLAISQPLLGALPHSAKQSIEIVVGDRRVFSNAGATGLNVLLNMVVYPALLVALAYVGLAAEVFSSQLKWFIFLGATLATIETAWRLREGVFQMIPASEMKFGPSLYGVLLGLAAGPWTRQALARRREVHKVGFDGFHDGNFDEKLERDRRYGDVYSVEDWGRAYFLRLEFPRDLPPSGLKEQLDLPDVMPDYDYDLLLTNGSFVVRGRVTDPRVKKLTAVAPAFPPEFMKQIGLEAAVCGFKHRYRDKVLEVLLMKKA